MHKYTEVLVSFCWCVHIDLSVQMSVMVNEKRLREEIKHLRRSLEVRAQLDEAAQRGQEAAGEAAAEVGHLGEGGTEESVLAHLRLWATFTCAHYGLEVSVFKADRLI